MATAWTPGSSKSGPPSGTAGGDLAGTYPNPSVAAVTTTTGPTSLVVGAVADGQFLKRNGANIIGAAAGFSTIQAVYSGSNVSIALGSSENLTWDSLDAGTELLNRSSPAVPVFLATGTYALTALVVGEALNPGGFASMNIRISGTPNTAIASAYTTSPPDGWSATAIFVAAAGATCKIVANNQDGAFPRTFSIDSATLVRLA